jgi:hypothetical protein
MPRDSSEARIFCNYGSMKSGYSRHYCTSKSTILNNFSHRISLPGNVCRGTLHITSRYSSTWVLRTPAEHDLGSCECIEHSLSLGHILIVIASPRAARYCQTCSQRRFPTVDKTRLRWRYPYHHSFMADPKSFSSVFGTCRNCPRRY